MSFLDKIVAAVTPPESDETRLEARARTRAEVVPGSWFSVVLDHHDRGRFCCGESGGRI
jgi:hypothetical protein